MKKQDWTNDLRSKLSDYQAPLPEGLWEDIEASLPQALPSGHRTLIPWRKWTVAAAIAVALMGGGAYLWHQYGMDTPNDNTTLASAHNLERNNPDVSPIETIEEEPILIQDEIATTHNVPTTNPTIPIKPSTKPIKPIMPNEPMMPNEPHEPIASPNEPNNPTLAQAETVSTPQKASDSSESSDVLLPANVDFPPITTQRKSSDPVVIGLFASNDAFSFTNSTPVLNYAMTNGSYFYDETGQQKTTRLPDY